MNRRDFLKATALASLAAMLEPQLALGADKPLSKRKLGRTNEHLSILGLGGIVVMGMSQSDANSTVSSAIDHGVNYIDVAPSYGDAEERLGPALKSYRDKVFLACKTGKRDKAGAMEALHQSLQHLQTDHFDLYQLHAMTTQQDVDQVFAPGGAMEAFTEARDKGLVRYLGFSAHSVTAALQCINRFDFDTILYPVNWVCWYNGDFGPQIMKAAKAKGMGILAIKAMALTPWPAGVEHTYPHCWYEPNSDPQKAALGLRFTLSHPITAAIPPGDVRLFNLGMTIAQRFKRITKEETEQLKTEAKGIQPIFRNA